MYFDSLYGVSCLNAVTMDPNRDRALGSLANYRVRNHVNGNDSFQLATIPQE